MKSTSGKFIAMAMIALALGAAVASLLYHLAAGDSALEFWGPSAAREIATAEHVEVWGFGEWDASQARGLGNIRRMLLEDASYDWTPRLDPAGKWRYELRFWSNRGHADVLVSDGGTTAAERNGPLLQLTPEAYETLRGFFDDLKAQPRFRAPPRR